MGRYLLADHLFASSWMVEFVQQWNLPANLESQLLFEKTGTVKFVLTENGHVRRSTIVDWDEKGKAYTKQENECPEILPTFLAPIQVWESVIYNYYTPIQAVVNKKMEFEGRIIFAVKFSEKFNPVADTAIAVNRIFSNG